MDTCDLHFLPLAILCFHNDCNQNRLGCQKCLLSVHKKHIKSCILLTDLPKKQFCNELLSNDENEQQFIKFASEELVSKEKLQKIVSQLQQAFKDDMKQIKIKMLQQEAKQKTLMMRKAKEVLKSYTNSFEFAQLKTKLGQFKEGKLSQEDLNNHIVELIQERQILQTSCQSQKIAPQKCRLSAEFKNMIINELSVTLESIKNQMRKDDSILFYKSQLSLEEEANIVETMKGKQFIFNDLDEVQLVYGSCTLTKGLYEFQINVEYLQEEQKKQEENQEGLESIIQPVGNLYNPYTSHTIGGHISNTGVFQQSEYVHLNRIYIGVVEDLVKDQQATYSIMYQTQQCCALDIVRGAQIGSFHMKQLIGEKVEPIQTVFQKNLKKGLILSFKINLDENKIYLTDSESRTRYEGQLYNMTADNLRPYILVYKSSVKITIS